MCSGGVGGDYFSGAVSKSSVYKVCECLKGGCVEAWLASLQDVSGSFFPNTTSVVRVCDVCPHLRLGGRGGAPVCVWVHAFTGLWVSLSVSPGGRCCLSPTLCLYVSARLCLYLQLCVPTSLLEHVHFLCEYESGHLCPWMCWRGCLRSMGAPACACVCTRPTRARSFFGTDTLPPSAQMTQSPRQLRAGAARSTPRPFSFPFPLLRPCSPWGARCIQTGAFWMGKGDR